MILSIVVTVCHLVTVNPSPVDPEGFSDPEGLRPVAASQLCYEQVLAEDDMPLQTCMLSQPQIAYWKEHSHFAGPRWQVKRWRCVPGHYIVKDAI